MVTKKDNSRILAWFSCGITSAVACKIAVEEYGSLVQPWYFEIDSAHPDNERFISECEQWLGVKVNRARSEKYFDQFEVARKTGFINGPGGARCTQELKSKVRKKIQKGGYDFQVFGFEYKKKEINRAVRFKQQNPKVRAIFPLIDKKLTKENCAAILIKSGIELPEMYKLGYKNNNCVGCLVGGGGYWNKIRNDFPETFLKMAEIEREIEGSCLNGIYLDELDPNFGRKQKHVAPECDSFCEIEFADLIDPITEKILRGECSI